MKIPLKLFPELTKKQYNLDTHARDGFVFLEIRRGVWGLPQAEILADKLLRKRLKPHGYYECVNTPGLWRHATRPITFSLIVNDFWNKICWEGACGSFNKMLERKIQTHQRLDRQLILWNHTQIGLQSENCVHFNAWLHQKSASEVQTHYATHTKLPVVTRAQVVWR
jgi:hypothetical protein